MISRLFYKLIATLILLLSLNSSIFAEEIRVGTITELKNPLNDIKISFEKKHPEHSITYMYLKETEIVNLIKEDPSPMDIIIIDSQKTLSNLSKQGYITSNSSVILGKDNICVVVKKSTAMRPFMLYPKTIVFESLACPNPNFTAAGKYVKESLISLGLWDKAPKKLVYFQDNQIVANRVASGMYDGGMMYCSFAKRSFVQISDIMNPKIHSKIVYLSGIKKVTQIKEAVTQFNNYLKSTEVKSILKKYYISP
jgi:molybdenum ABC transporter molybdate-binding protein